MPGVGQQGVRHVADLAHRRLVAGDENVHAELKQLSLGQTIALVVSAE